MTSPPVPPLPVGLGFAEARKRLGWTLRDAERESGVPNAHISQIETGTIAQPGPAVVAKLARAYGLEPPLPPQAVDTAEASLRSYLEPWLSAEAHGTTLASQIRTAAALALREAAPHFGHEMDLAVLEATREATAAERERCAQLAESVRATYADTQPPGAPVGDGHYWHPFAALLREAQ